MKLRNKLTYYRDVEIMLTPRQWSTFVTPMGIDVLWDNYNFKKNTVVGRFFVSEAHVHPDMRKTLEDLDRFIESLGDYVVTDHSRNVELEKNVKHWGQRTLSYEGNPLVEAMKKERKDIDIHRVDTEGRAGIEEGRHYDAKRIISKEDLLEINQGIIVEADKDPVLKRFKDSRQKYERQTNDGYEVYTAILEEIN